jgi:hypothetical protein
MLRQAWRAGLAEPEAMRPNELRQRLEGRGFAQSGVDPAPIDDLVGLLPESDDAWKLRRAATEVAQEPGLRLIRYAGLVLPEDQQRLDPTAVGQLARSLLGELVDDPAIARQDPLEEHRRAIEQRGRIGMVLTELEIAPDLSGVSVVATLWVRAAPGQWVPMIRRPAQVRTSDVDRDAVVGLAADPRVEQVFRLVDGLGLGSVGGDARRLSLDIGAATRQALGIAQSALHRELEALALPVAR